MVFIYIETRHMVLYQSQKLLKGRYAILYIELIYAFEGLSKTFEKTFLTNRRFTKISSTLDLFTLKKGKYGFIHTIELNEREDINSKYVSFNTSAILNENSFFIKNLSNVRNFDV